jgi:hypothetical protein
LKGLVFNIFYLLQMLWVTASEREREREMTSKQKVVESLGIFICRFGGERILKSGEM